MSRREKNRWKSKFGRFVLAYGVARLAAKVEIDPSAVYHWVRGLNAPRRTHAMVIRDLAHEEGVRLTLDQIYGHCSDRLIVDPDCATRIPREEWRVRVRAMTLRREGG